MSRKRSSFNILKDYSISSTPNQPSAEDFIITTRKRSSKCNGNLVDPRTKKAHDKKLALVTHSAIIRYSTRRNSLFGCYSARRNSNKPSVN